jgi:hypothetical protein
LTLLERPQRPQRPQSTMPRRPAAGRAGIGMLAVGSFVAGLAGKAFAKYGFATAGLITEWPAIAGQDLALYTRPERLRWPPAARDGVEGAPSQGGQRGRQGATLLLRVDAARGLDVQFRARQIIERINGYFGYAAIAELRILQGPIATPAAAKARAPLKADANGAAQPAGEDPTLPMLMRISDAGLRAALVRLGEGVRQGSRS